MKRRIFHSSFGSNVGKPFILIVLVIVSIGIMASEEPPATGENGCDKNVQKDTEQEYSFFTQLWELDENTRRGSYTITPHRSNYILPYTYNFNPNEAVLREAEPGKDLVNSEVTFQLSLKVKLWEDVAKQDMDLWVAYTQRSFWQLYDFQDSSPFRDTNYEPELLLNYRTNYSLFGVQNRFINVGINHQSNGQSEPLSRSWNRVVANAGFEVNNFSFLVRGWCRIPEDDRHDDNPKIEKYLGYGELWSYYFWKKNRFGLMLRNNLRFHDNLGAVQAEWSFPLFKKISGYLQYFYGYGESLMDYDHRVNRVGLGIILQ